MALPTSPIAITTDDIYNAVYDFLFQNVFPTIPENNIIRGWENHSALPAGTEEYIVMSVLSHTRLSTNAEHYPEVKQGQPEEMTMTLETPIDVAIQIDFCSSNDNAMLRAQTIETIFQSYIAPKWFKKNSIFSALYCEPCKDMSFLSGTKQYVKRWMITIHLSYRHLVTFDMEFFKTVKINPKPVA